MSKLTIITLFISQLCVFCVMKKRLTVSFVVLLLFCAPLYSQNFFASEPRSNTVHILLEGAIGGDYYRSHLSPLYKTDQWVMDGSATLGYKFERIYVGLGGGVRHCENDQKTSFPVAASFLAFASCRHVFSDIKLKPYAGLRGGVTVYPKWNDFAKPYVALEGGIHILPRLIAGGRLSWCGTLDNRHTTELTLCIGFCI